MSAPPKPRFELRATHGAAWLIHDNKDDSVVCFVYKGTRPIAHTRNMAETMLAALNAAGQPRKEEA